MDDSLGAAPSLIVDLAQATIAATSEPPGSETPPADDVSSGANLPPPTATDPTRNLNADERFAARVGTTEVELMSIPLERGSYLDQVADVLQLVYGRVSMF